MIKKIGKTLWKILKYSFRFLKNIIMGNDEFRTDVQEIKQKFSELKKELSDLLKYFK